jgi:ACS family glucarate transporter-like MFS transporter
VRYRVLAYLCALSMITYLDRACFGSALESVAGELGYRGAEDLQWAVVAFSVAYSVFEIPSAWLGDTIGPRAALVRIVIWWSTFTALTALVGYNIGGLTIGLGALVVIRFLFGAGEAGAYPNITRAVHNWFPLVEWNTAQGLVWMSGRLMGGLTPLIWALLTTANEGSSALLTWRGAFVLLGGIGLVWCFGFARTFRNRPAEHPAINKAELATIEAGQAHAPDASHDLGGVPWRAFVKSPNLWFVCLMYLCINHGWVFHVTILPAYLQERFGLDKRSMEGALLKGAPLWIGALACIVGGVGVARLLRHASDRGRVRRIVGVTCLSGCALCWWWATTATNVVSFCIAASLAAFLSDLTLASAWATCQEIGGRYAAITAACMNTIGTLGSVLNAWLTFALVKRAVADRAAELNTDAEKLTSLERLPAIEIGYDQAFASYAAAYVIAALCWLLIDSTKPIVASKTSDAQTNAH